MRELSSLVKYARQAEPVKKGQQGTFWGRLQQDGLPFRGTADPMLRSDEAEEYLVRVAEAKNSTFDLSDEEQNKRYLLVLDRAANGWFVITYIERWREEGTKHHTVYVEWLEYCMEDGRPTRPGTGGM